MALYASDYGYTTGAQACIVCGKLAWPCACLDAIRAYERGLAKREAEADRLAAACAQAPILAA